MTVTITQVKNSHGDLELHVGGCKDIDKHARRMAGNADRPSHYSGETLVEALVAADTDMAAWFVEEPYTQSSRDNGCWTVLTNGWAPCFRSLLRTAGVQFDEETGRPSVQGE